VGDATTALVFNSNIASISITTPKTNRLVRLAGFRSDEQGAALCGFCKENIIILSKFHHRVFRFLCR
jgi:hypothetical protein